MRRRRRRRAAAGGAADAGMPTVLLGRELERRLGVAEGDLLRLVAVDIEDLSFSYRKVRNGKSFETGFAEADAGWVMVDRELVEELGGRSSLLEIGVEDPLADRGDRRRRCRRSSATSSWSPTGGSSTASCSPRCACRRWRCSWSSD